MILFIMCMSITAIIFCLLCFLFFFFFICQPKSFFLSMNRFCMLVHQSVIFFSSYGIFFYFCVCVFVDNKKVLSVYNL